MVVPLFLKSRALWISFGTYEVKNFVIIFASVNQVFVK